MDCTTSLSSSNDMDIEELTGKEYRKKRDIDFIKLEPYVKDILKSNLKSRDEVKNFIHENKKKYKMIPSLLDLLFTYRMMSQRDGFTYDARYDLLFQSKMNRFESGVNVIAVFTSPYPEIFDETGKVIGKQEFSCEYDCYFCPKEPDQPRSYLKGEPGVMRANENDFDPYRQFIDRGTAYTNMSKLDKVELLVLGGTWSSYPESYQYWFINQIMYAANTFYDDKENLRPMLPLKEEQKLNETALCKIIGITLETRPDKVTPREIKKFRNMNVTRVQLGVQHSDNRLLERVNRMCTIERVKEAIKLLKDNCFKVDIHLMPDLPQPLKPGVDIKKGVFDPEDIDFTVDVKECDLKMFDDFSTDPELDADQWKIYMCETTYHTNIFEDYKRGSYKPYGDQKDKKEWTHLCDVLIEVLPKVPDHIRINRLVRDIPNSYIKGGNQDVNLRTKIENMLIKRGTPCRCIRCREVKEKKNADKSTAVLKVKIFEASGGTEYFLSFVTPDESVIFGFLRLRLSNNSGKNKHDNVIFEELVGTALIRELHVYGQVVKVDNNNVMPDGSQTTQHSGFGKRLVQKAFEIAEENEYERIAVISGIGVKNYYRKFGFEDENYFMTKILKVNNEPIKEQIIEKIDDPIENYTTHFFFATIVIAVCWIIFR
jgi:ELP3 family radical SAM enzyme/protein acetyltransferase